jgi:hypothetical protein
MESSSQPRFPADGRAGARPSPPRSPAFPSEAPRRERVYRGIVVTAVDLVRIAEAMRVAGGEIELFAEDWRFGTVDDLVDFALEEMSVARLEIAARSGRESLRLAYTAERVVLTAVARDPEMLGAFWRASAVLDACRPTGTTVCDIAPGESPQRGVLAALRRTVRRQGG